MGDGNIVSVSCYQPITGVLMGETDQDDDTCSATHVLSVIPAVFVRNGRRDGATSYAHPAGVVPLLAFRAFDDISSCRRHFQRKTTFLCLTTTNALSSLQIPSATPVTRSGASKEGHPLLLPLTGASALLAFLSYNTSSVRTVASIFCFTSAIISIWGFWAVSDEFSSW